ncbi:MAG: dienelactone hydrolase [Paenibacillus sp.]|jgi:dienelactone hydrolase|nr:dienelactone hydrolase [Paenibacillus sp.]
MWNPDDFLEQLYKDTAVNSFNAKSYEEWTEWRTGLKGALIKALVLPSQPDIEMDPVLLERVDCGDYFREHIQLTTAPLLNMPLYLLLPKNGKPPYPAIVACPGHGYGYKELVGLLPDGSVRSGEPGIYKDYPIELVKRGFIVIVPELLGLGDRRLEQDRDKAPKENSCFRLSANLLMAGKTLAGYRVHELMRCIDYMLLRGDAAPDRIGCMGFSGGGLVSALTAAIDERIGAAVISGYTNTYRDSILAKSHCPDNYIPGLLGIAEMPELFGLIAPRPLLIEAGEKDRGFPLQGVLTAVGRLQSVYRAANAEEKLETDFHSGKHEVSGRIAYDWLKARLTR